MVRVDFIFHPSLMRQRPGICLCVLHISLIQAPKVPIASSGTSTVADKKYSWKDVAQHCTASSAWVIAEGNVYDITGEHTSRRPWRPQVYACCVVKTWWLQQMPSWFAGVGCGWRAPRPFSNQEICVSTASRAAADWLDIHPGGKEMLLLAAGREITDLLASYHPFSEKPMKMLASRKVGWSPSLPVFPPFLERGTAWRSSGVCMATRDC